jgi:hypothetical protein
LRRGNYPWYPCFEGPLPGCESVRTVPAGLSVFHIGDDGKLTFALDVGDKTMFWMGMVPL